MKNTVGTLFPVGEPETVVIDAGDALKKFGRLTLPPIDFTVHGIPVGQPRASPSAIYRRGPDGKPQLVTKEGRDGRAIPIIRMSNSDRRGRDIGTWRSMIAQAGVFAWGETPLVSEGPVILVAKFFFPRPGRLIWKTKPMPEEPMFVKPDLKNLLWAVEDALTGIVWRDDAQICGYGDSGKWHVAGAGYGDEMARAEISIRRFQA